MPLSGLQEGVVKSHKLWQAIENGCFVLVIGFVGTALLSYPIRMYFYKEFFERLSPLGNVLFFLALWIVVTVLFAAPLLKWWDEEQ